MFRYRISRIIPRAIACVFVLAVAANLFFFESEAVWQKRLTNAALESHHTSNFNPRTVMSLFYDYVTTVASELSMQHPMGRPEGVNFHWDDWVDLQGAAGGARAARVRNSDPQGLCPALEIKFALIDPYWMELYHTKIERQTMYTYCVQEIPERIVGVTENALIEVPVVGRKRLGMNDRKVQKDLSSTVKGAFKALQGTSLGSIQVIRKQNFQREVELTRDDFTFDPAHEMARLKLQLARGELELQDFRYLEMLQYGNLVVDTAGRYFKYPWVYLDLFQGQAHHLEAAFFRRFVPERERRLAIHHMIRAWFEILQAYGFVSWVNWGLLLGWTYNGANMPWDTDVDIQMPIAELDRLGRRLNGTLFLEDPRYGNARWYLKVAPHYVRQGNGRNFIDARFIDVTTGLYIDISALSISSYEAPKELYDGLTEVEKLLEIPVHCKNFNWQLLLELLPLKYTSFEGGGAYIPNKISRILDRKYGHSSYTLKLHFHHHNYQEDISMWVPDRVCKSAPISTRFEVNSAGRYDHLRLLLEGACGLEYLRDEYRISYPLTKRHRTFESSLDLPVTYDVAKMGHLPILRKDPYDYYTDLNSGVTNSTDWFVEL